MSDTARQLDKAELEAGLDHLRGAPRDAGRVDLIVRRPAVDERELVEEATIDDDAGLVGDNWATKPSLTTGAPNPLAQLTLMNARVSALLAPDGDERRALSGDQLHVDFDISYDNIPPGTRLRVGEAVIEITDEPHRGCGKFSARFGVDAMKFVNSKVGRELNLRGVNARVVSGGVVRRGDAVVKDGAAPAPSS